MKKHPDFKEMSVKDIEIYVEQESRKRLGLESD
jgi:hypothetical protein